jgi:hypothetical protein
VPSLVIGAVGLLPVALLCWSLGLGATRAAVAATIRLSGTPTSPSTPSLVVQMLSAAAWHLVNTDVARIRESRESGPSQNTFGT